ncbi:N utilization substance protein B homolog [Anaerococcus prevotii]|uniref:NusB antitermination factor n=1 Tax=Anaerococcus prevotii (strain ATCC 9321 / DSM 20548 / JCM 6508 / NCTC 11806 / PC1) TaxID=525919 RepID=C7RHU9_ANAPD|nr:transcription antitermination factor NusB [Anaerococcus prevotii]ACV29060.1 NusB antitermination factor [Anaerococcus prevotii DSM 20548]SUU94733.1 N utilization substance protein B homolog [Anaerococcus prevotii]
MNRVEQREWVFKLIYQDSISKIEDIDKALEELDLTDEDFVRKSISSFLNNFSSIDEKLTSNLDSKRKRLSKVLRSILYLSINEMYFMDIPVSVSINEAVNLAKKYSDEDDYKLVNSILGSIVRKDGK